MKRLLLPIIAFLFGSLMGQTSGQDYKSKGIASFRANQNDSALIYLNLALEADEKDGEVLCFGAGLFSNWRCKYSNVVRS